MDGCTRYAMFWLCNVLPKEKKMSISKAFKISLRQENCCHQLELQYFPSSENRLLFKTVVVG